MNSVLDGDLLLETLQMHHWWFLLAILHSPNSLPAVKCQLRPLQRKLQPEQRAPKDTHEPKGQKHKPVAWEHEPRAWGNRVTSSCLPAIWGLPFGPLAQEALSLDLVHAPLLPF